MVRTALVPTGHIGTNCVRLLWTLSFSTALRDELTTRSGRRGRVCFASVCDKGRITTSKGGAMHTS